MESSNLIDKNMFLAKSILERYIDNIKCIIELGADVNFLPDKTYPKEIKYFYYFDAQRKTFLSPFKCKNTYTPLILALQVAFPSIDIISFLIEKGADVNKLDCNECSPLIHLVNYEIIDNIVFEKILELLIKNGADHNFKYNNKNALEILIEKKSNLLSCYLYKLKKYDKFEIGEIIEISTDKYELTFDENKNPIIKLKI